MLLAMLERRIETLFEDIVQLLTAINLVDKLLIFVCKYFLLFTEVIHEEQILLFWWTLAHHTLVGDIF